jgi:hypothetical protein
MSDYNFDRIIIRRIQQRQHLTQIEKIRLTLFFGSLLASFSASTCFGRICLRLLNLYSGQFDVGTNNWATEMRSRRNLVARYRTLSIVRFWSNQAFTIFR